MRPTLATVAALGLKIGHSPESEALYTAGGSGRALFLLRDVFWRGGGEVLAPNLGFDPAAAAAFAASDALAHLWLAPNPPQHRLGDFQMCWDGTAV